VKHKREILASIADVGTERWVRDDRQKRLDALAKDLGARSSEIARFDRGYDALWTKHGPILQARIHAEPPDFAALIDGVRDYWRDEDALVDSVMGAQARDDHRAADMRSRTAIVAILAALGDKPFDDALEW
jgi:hypothetical protein